MSARQQSNVAPLVPLTLWTASLPPATLKAGCRCGTLSPPKHLCTARKHMQPLSMALMAVGAQQRAMDRLSWSRVAGTAVSGCGMSGKRMHLWPRLSLQTLRMPGAHSVHLRLQCFISMQTSNIGTCFDHLRLMRYVDSSMHQPRAASMWRTSLPWASLSMHQPEIAHSQLACTVTGLAGTAGVLRLATLSTRRNAACLRAMTMAMSSSLTCA